MMALCVDGELAVGKKGERVGKEKMYRGRWTNIEGNEEDLVFAKNVDR